MTDQLPELAEQARPLIAGVLKFPHMWPRVAELVGEVFEPTKIRGDAWTRTAWLALGNAADAGEEIDPIVLREQMRTLTKAARPELLTEWADACDKTLLQVIAMQDLAPRPGAVISAAERVITTFANYDLANYTAGMQKALRNDALADPYELIDGLQMRLRETCRRAGKFDLGNAAAGTKRALESTRPAALMTGFAELDKHGGIDFGEITLLGARTGGGKSVFLQDLARNQIFPCASMPVTNIHARAQVQDEAERVHVLVMSCENPARMMYERLACDMLDINSDDLRRDRQEALHVSDANPSGLSSGEYIEALSKYGRLTVIDEESMKDISVSTVCATIEMWADMVLAEDPDAKMLVLVDYLQRVDPTAEQSREQRYRQIELAAKGLKGVLKSRKECMALVLAVQLNDVQGNSEPRRGDNRESRGSNNEAGNIWMLHSWDPAQRAAILETYDNAEGREHARAMSLYCDKARSVEPGWRVPFVFDGAHYRITDALDPKANPLFDPAVLAVANSTSRRGGKSSKSAGLTLADDDEFPMGGAG